MYFFKYLIHLPKVNKFFIICRLHLTINLKFCPIFTTGNNLYQQTVYSIATQHQSKVLCICDAAMPSFIERPIESSEIFIFCLTAAKIDVNNGSNYPRVIWVLETLQLLWNRVGVAMQCASVMVMYCLRYIWSVV